jgi:hypothetical protein
MSFVTATIAFDQEAGTVKFSLDLQGETELEHELLAATIGSGRGVSIVPAHRQNELFAEFIIVDKSIWPKAIRGLENRRRVANGQPTVEDEEAQARKREAADKQAEIDAVAARDKAAKDAAAAQKAEDDRQVSILRQALGK